MSERDYFILGAGFSRAANSKMPLLKDLFEPVRERLNLSTEELQPFEQNVELWLSHIGSDQPWLTPSQNVRNRAQFLDASTALTEVVSSMQEASVQSGLNPWVEKFVFHLTSHESTVVTLNYDLLLEKMLYDHLRIAPSDIYTIPIQNVEQPKLLSAAPTKPAYYVPAVHKLHGSLNWYYPGALASPSDSIVLDMNETGTHPTDSRVAKSLTPLIVPPTATKASYYENIYVRAQWKQALEELKEARSLTIIGFSFPSTDYHIRHFVSSECYSCHQPSR